MHNVAVYPGQFCPDDKDRFKAGWSLPRIRGVHVVSEVFPMKTVVDANKYVLLYAVLSDLLVFQNVKSIYSGRYCFLKYSNKVTFGYYSQNKIFKDFAR